ncbi:DUF6338 family protein [Streptomyces sp. NPDC092370]|uniref:DUF6338 family protein n=1 Tax=Streptomyces sp. NPDC092370 TaxID=3366016 RepID=UPI00380F9D38
MPTTLTGFALVIVMLLPGFSFIVARERAGTDRRPTPFRESSAVVFASVVAELVTLVMFALIRGLWPGATPDVGRVVREQHNYVSTHYAELGWWAGALLIVACLIAATGGVILGRRPHASAMSAWWVMFDRWFPGENPIVGCILEDGSYIEGRQASYNVGSDDLPDRDLILVEPIKYRAPGGTEARLYPASGVCISARRIMSMFVTYPTITPSEAGAAAQGADPALASASAHLGGQGDPLASSGTAMPGGDPA